jgi:hypothetical protein
MGKRSSFKRVPRDFYPTPFKAVPPLIPYLRGVRTFAEPCAGDGALVRHLEGVGLRCVSAGDIATGQDALGCDNYGDADVIITNPPFSRENRVLVCKLFTHFREIGPTWLLLPADWMHNQWAAPFMPSCTDIVSIGRVCWVEGTKKNSMENFAWYRFDVRHSAGPILHARGAPVESRASLCGQCGKPHRPQRSDARLCCDRCRQRAHRSRITVTSRDVARPGDHTTQRRQHGIPHSHAAAEKRLALRRSVLALP